MSGKKESKKNKKEKKNSRLVKYPSANVVVRLLAALASYLPEVTGVSNADVAARKKFASPDQLFAFNAFRRREVAMQFGTQMPSLILRSANLYTTGIVNAAQFSHVDTVSWFNCQGKAQLLILFDEYQMHGGWHHQYPGLTPGIALAASENMLCIGALDYDTVGVFTSYAQALYCDTHKMFYIESSTPGITGEKWKIEPQGIPDETWITTGSDHVICYWKCIGGIAAATVANAMYTYFSVKVRFRQLID